VIPRISPPSNALNRAQDFALCLDCHYGNEVLALEVDHTNFWNDDENDRNSHYIHLGIRDRRYDSDFDGVKDSAISCPACHNVHGAPNQAMVRHGELISTPGTTDKVPALNFAYLIGTPPGTRDTGATLSASIGAEMDYAAPSIDGNYVCQACHGAVPYYRAPKTLPKVIAPDADPATAPPDGATLVLFSALIVDDSGTLSTVVIDLSAVGGSAGQAMYDDGSNGDVTSGDGIYSYQTTVADTVEPGVKDLLVTATNASGQGQNVIVLNVDAPGVYIINDTDAMYECTWSYKSGLSEAYSGDMHYLPAGTGSCTATWTPDIEAGTYEVYAWWQAGSVRATDAPYTITYDGGSETIDTNQQINGGQWNLLGTYPFAAGTSGSVELSDDANGYVIADGIKFEQQ